MPGRVLLEPGKRIGRFDIQQAIHSTDLAATYKANDADYERIVALKIIYETDKAAIESHLAAARGASKLDHENIAATHGGGQLQGGVLLVSEFHDGLALSTRLTRKEAFAWTEVLDIARQLCGAVDYSRTKDAIHKRLHPGNVQVGWDGSIKILDFSSGPATQDAYTGWAYMSPEQVRGEAPSAASNLFSLAAMLYHIVVGQSPFPGENAAAIKERILQGQPQKPSEVKPNIPEGIANTLMKGLAANPSERYAMGIDLCAELEKHRFWNPAVSAPNKPQAAPPELAKPFVIGVKPIQHTSPETVAAASATGSFAAGTGSHPAATGRNPVQNPQANSSMRMATQQSGNNALELVSTQETVYGGDAQATPAPVEQTPAVQPGASLDATAKSRSGSNTRLPRQSQSLPPLPPAARAGMELDAAWGKMKNAAKSPRHPLEWALMGVGVLLLAVLLIVLGVQTYFHHKSEVESASDSATNSSSSATATDNTAAAPQGSAAVVQQTDVPMQAQTTETQEEESTQKEAKHKGKTKTKPTPVVAAAVVVPPGAVMITVQPGDAQIFADGAAFMTGSGIKQLAPGQHTFTFSRAGYASQTLIVKVSSGMQTNVPIRLTAQAAMVSLNTSPSGANIYVDGKDTGKLSPAEVTVSEGNHTVTLRKYGFLDSINNANAKAGQTVAITATLQPTNNEPIKTVGGGMHLFGGGVPAGMVKVKFLCSPKGAQVQINGQLLDRSTPVEAVLKPGKYQVDFMADGYKTDHKVITVTDDKKQEFSSTLQQF